MKPIHRYLILCSYLILWITVFWNSDFFVDCSGFLCALLPVLVIWTLFIGSTILVLFLKPLKFKKVLLRFFVTAWITITGYVIYYNTISYHNFDYHFNDYTLPGILLTIGFSLSWLLPDKIDLSYERWNK